VRLLLVLKLVLGLLAFSFGSVFWSVVALMVASNRVVTEGTCKLLGLVISDLVDEDYVKRYRTMPLSALIFGSANFLAKPGQTLAPILGTYLIYDHVGSVFGSAADAQPLGAVQLLPLA
jgi:hypothetical protein